MTRPGPTYQRTPLPTAEAGHTLLTQVQDGTIVLRSETSYLTTLGTEDPNRLIYAVHLRRKDMEELHEALSKALEVFR